MIQISVIIDNKSLFGVTIPKSEIILERMQDLTRLNILLHEFVWVNNNFF